MKKLLILLCYVLVCVACGSDESKSSEQPKRLEESEQFQDDDKWAEAEDVPFEEYSLDGTNAEWVVTLDVESQSDGEIVVIHNTEEFESYVAGDYPPIDFAKKTLVLAYGMESNMNYPIKQGLKYLQERDYAMTIEMQSSLATLESIWYVAVVVDKLPVNSEVELKITRN